MTDDKDPGSGARRASRPPYRTIAWGALRIAGSTAVLVTLYYLLPLTHSSLASAVTILVIGLAVFIGLVAVQVRAIIRSRSRGCGASRPWPPASRCSCCCSPAVMS